jgi:hypothetical protein
LKSSKFVNKPVKDDEAAWEGSADDKMAVMRKSIDVLDKDKEYWKTNTFKHVPRTKYWLLISSVA